MKKSLWAAFVLAVLAFGSLPFALARIRESGENIQIAEETLWGDLRAARGITLQVASHWEGHLLWTTRYSLDSKKAESRFTFSPRQVSWDRTPQREAGLLFGTRNSIMAAAGDSQPDFRSYEKIIDAVAQRTRAGESHEETVRIGDYYAFYPMGFSVDGSSVYYEGDFEQGCAYLTDYFHIGTLEDKLKVQIEKDPKGNVVSIYAQIVPGDKAFGICSASAFCENGFYYACYLENPDTGETVDRGQNRGIFYFPYSESKGFMHLDVTRVEKMCELPETVTPLQMLRDEEREILYLAVREGETYHLLVYTTDGGKPVLTQQVLISRDERPQQILTGRDEQPPADKAARLMGMSLAEGGLLLTWSDNRFVFAVTEDGAYRQWCDGVFPDVREDTGAGSPPFPQEHICVFDGQRLILAAFSERRSLDAVLAVYQEDGCSYSGLFRYPAETDENGGSLIHDRLHRILPQGVTWGDFFQGAGTDAGPLELIVE